MLVASLYACFDPAYCWLKCQGVRHKDMKNFPTQVDPGLNVHVLNAMILDVHRAGSEVGYDKFQRLMLDEIQALISFDSACWGNVVTDPFALDNPRLFNCDESISTAFRQLWPQDCFFAALAAEPGLTINLSDQETRARLASSDICGELGKHYGIASVLGTLRAKPVSAHYEFLVLWRNDPMNPFSEADRQGMQLLMPHLMQAQWLACQCAIFKDARRRSGNWCVADAWGFVHHATPGFVNALNGHWPGWRGSQLPTTMLEYARMGQPFQSGPLTIDVAAKGELLHLEVRAIGALDRLSPREREIAQRYARGETHLAIALALAISPATVRNHLAHCFHKLGVSNKAELALIHFHKGAQGSQRQM